MTTLTIEQGNNTETVSNAVIQKLYNIASNSTNVTLAGNLQCGRCYQDVYDYFTGYVTEGVKRFPNLSLTVTSGKYATFADPVIQDYFAKSTYGDGVGFATSSISSISTFPKRETIPNTAFNSDYFSYLPNDTTYLNNGCYAFYKDKNVKSFNELGQFSNITTIPTSMFRESTLKYIDLSNITKIEAAAFAGADLTGIINLPKFKQWGDKSVSTSVNIYDLYFANNPHMTEIHIGADVSDEDKITSVPGRTFYNCSSLSEVTGLNMVTNIGQSAFYNCSSLLEVPELNMVTGIGDSAFFGCSSLPEITGLNTVTSIGNKAFLSCSSLSKISGLNAATSIGESAFLDCLGLSEVTGLNAVISISKSAFYNCSNLSEVTGLNVVTSIGESAFLDCSSLSKVSLPMITSIGNKAFYNCSNLSEVTGLNVVTSIGTYAFYNCSSLENLQGLNDTTAINIGNYSFCTCTSLKCIDLTNINLFGEHAFVGCSNLTALDTNDLDHINDNTEYTLSADSLGTYAFKNTGLNGKTLKFTNINSISEGAFEGSGLNKFIGTNVTTTGSNVFKNCAQLLEVLFGNVTTINPYTFLNCSNLTTIKFGNLTNDFSNITSIANYAFDGCSSLSSISNLTDILNIGNYSFRNCEILFNLLSLPSLTSIGSCAFAGCTGIQSVTDLGQITQLPVDCFLNCTNLTSAIIPGTVTSVNINAFSNSGVLRIIVNEGCTSIFMGGFNSYNGSIGYIELPSTVTACGSSFHDDTFSSNSNNSVIIVIKAVTPPTATKRYWSLNCYRKISKIYVPDDSVSAYLNSSDNIWGLEDSYFPHKIAPISQLETDNPTYWAVYQSGLSNS